MGSKIPFDKAENEFLKGDFKKSIQLYTLAIELDPNNAHYISQRGVAFFRMGKIEEALYDLNKALKLEPDNPYRYSSRAFILSNLNRTEEAILDYEQAIRLDPDDAIAHNNLGLLFEKKGYQKQANGYFNKADKLEGISLRSNNTPQNEDDFEVKNNSRKEIYRGDSYWEYVRKVFTDTNVRKEFFRFVRNGFRVK